MNINIDNCGFGESTFKKLLKYFLLRCFLLKITRNSLRSIKVTDIFMSTSKEGSFCIHRE